MNNMAIETIDLLNSKFGEILCRMVDERLTNSYKNTLLQLSFHIREVNNANDNILAAQYAKDNNLEELYKEMLESKLVSALQFLESIS